MSALEVHILDGGTIDINDWSVFNPDAPAGTVRRLSDPVYLVVHERGSLVWDTGVGDGLAAVGTHRVNDFATFHVEQTVEGQLAALGHPAGSIDYLAVSHFHGDHVGNVGLFSTATLLVQHDEWASTARPGGSDLTEEQYAALSARPVIELDGSHDVFGDGTVVIQRFPGHTVGSQSLLLRPSGRGSILISGDVVHSWENWEKGLVPQELNFDVAESLRSIDKARQLVADENAELWIQHELEQYELLRLTVPRPL